MYEQLKQECFDANLELPKLDLVIYNFGNVSAVDREHGVFAIKPSGVPYDELKADDMVIVCLETGKVVEGTMRPSSDTNTHLVLYRNYPTIGGVCHTHSTYAVGWAQAARPVPIYGTTHADHLATDIPCTEFMTDEAIQRDYETETGNQIVNCNLNPSEIEMVLVAGHGPFTWGKNAAKAVYNAKVLEELCKMALITEQANPQAKRLKDTLIAKHYFRKHGANAYYGQTK